MEQQEEEDGNYFLPNIDDLIKYESPPPVNNIWSNVGLLDDLTKKRQKKKRAEEWLALVQQLQAEIHLPAILEAVESCEATSLSLSEINLAEFSFALLETDCPDSLRKAIIRKLHRLRHPNLEYNNEQVVNPQEVFKIENEQYELLDNKSKEKSCDDDDDEKSHENDNEKIEIDQNMIGSHSQEDDIDEVKNSVIEIQKDEDDNIKDEITSQNIILKKENEERSLKLEEDKGILSNETTIIKTPSLPPSSLLLIQAHSEVSSERSLDDGDDGEEITSQHQFEKKSSSSSKKKSKKKRTIIPSLTEKSISSSISSTSIISNKVFSLFKKVSFSEVMNETKVKGWDLFIDMNRTLINCDYEIKWILLFIYFFSDIVHMTIGPYAPSWASVCLFYAFLIQVLCTGKEDMTEEKTAFFRKAVLLTFLLDGVSHPSMLHGFDRYELIIVSHILIAIRCLNRITPFILFSFASTQVLYATFCRDVILSGSLFSGPISFVLYFITQYFQVLFGVYGILFVKQQQLPRKV